MKILKNTHWLLVLVFLLPSCTTTVSPVSNVVKQVQADARIGAEKARKSAVKTNDKECADALNLCAAYHDNCLKGVSDIERSCVVEKKEARQQSFNRGMLWGGGIVLLIFSILIIIGNVISKKRE